MHANDGGGADHSSQIHGTVHTWSTALGRLYFVFLILKRNNIDLNKATHVPGKTSACEDEGKQKEK